MTLSRDQIFEADDLPMEKVDVPEWGGYVFVRGLTGVERDAWETNCTMENGKQIKRNPQNIRASLVVLAAVDDDRKKIFKKIDVERLGTKSGKALDRVFEVAARLAGIRDEDIEELAGNSPDDPSDDSG